MDILNDNATLQCNITPEAVYISTNPNQSSYANIVITIINNNAQPLNVSTIGVTVPPALAPAAALNSITALAGQPQLWSFTASGLTAGEFDAQPIGAPPVIMNQGDSWTFSLQNVTLVNTIVQDSANVTVVMALQDGENITVPLTVSIENALACINSFNSQPANIKPGQSVTITWQCEKINYCTISPGDGTHLQESGKIELSPQDTTNYTLYAYGDGVILSAQWAVSVDVPVINKFGTRDSVRSAQLFDNITLVWDCNQFTQYCTIADDAGVTSLGNQPISGSILAGPIMMPTTFTLTACGDNNEVYDQLDRKITVPDLAATFTANPDSGVWIKDKVTISWSIANAVTISVSPPLENGPSLQNLAGSVTIFPDQDIVYTLTVTGFIKNEPKSVYVPLKIAVEQVAIKNFAIAPAGANNAVNQVTLTWDTNAQVVSIDNNIGAVTTTGTQNITGPANGANFTLSAGTTQNPGLLTQTVTNIFGPFQVTAFDSDYNDGYCTISFQVPNSNEIDAFFEKYVRNKTVYFGALITGINANVPLTLDATITEAGGFYITATYSINVTLSWSDPNTPSGTAIIISV